MSGSRGKSLMQSLTQAVGKEAILSEKGDYFDHFNRKEPVFPCYLIDRTIISGNKIPFDDLSILLSDIELTNFRSDIVLFKFGNRLVEIKTKADIEGVYSKIYGWVATLYRSRSLGDFNISFVRMPKKLYKNTGADFHNEYFNLIMSVFVQSRSFFFKRGASGRALKSLLSICVGLYAFGVSGEKVFPDKELRNVSDTVRRCAKLYFESGCLVGESLETALKRVSGENIEVAYFDKKGNLCYTLVNSSEGVLMAYRSVFPAVFDRM